MKNRYVKGLQKHAQLADVVLDGVFRRIIVPAVGIKSVMPEIACCVILRVTLDQPYEQFPETILVAKLHLFFSASKLAWVFRETKIMRPRHFSWPYLISRLIRFLARAYLHVRFHEDSLSRHGPFDDIRLF